MPLSWNSFYNLLQKSLFLVNWHHMVPVGVLKSSNPEVAVSPIENNTSSSGFPQ